MTVIKSNKNTSLKKLSAYISLLFLLISCGHHEEPGVINIEYKTESGANTGTVTSIFEVSSADFNRKPIYDTVLSDSQGKCTYSAEFECYLQVLAKQNSLNVIKYQLHFVPDQTKDTLIYLK